MSGWKIEAGGWPVASERRLAAGFGHSDIKGVHHAKAGHRPALRPPVAKHTFKAAPRADSGWVPRSGTSRNGHSIPKPSELVTRCGWSPTQPLSGSSQRRQFDLIRTSRFFRARFPLSPAAPFEI